MHGETVTFVLVILLNILWLIARLILELVMFIVWITIRLGQPFQGGLAHPFPLALRLGGVTPGQVALQVFQEVLPAVANSSPIIPKRSSQVRKV